VASATVLPVGAVSDIMTRVAKVVRVDVLLAVALTGVGELEALFAPANGDRLVSAAFLPLVTLSLAWRRPAPLATLAVVTLALLAQAPLDGFLVGQAVTPLIAVVLALYSAGRRAVGAVGLAGAILAVVVIVATRIAFDPGVKRASDAILTLVVALPLLVGHWVRGQVLLQRQLEAKVDRLTRERERNALHAAEEERMRIAADVQVAVADGLRLIVAQARELPDRVHREEHAQARMLFASIAATARNVLADVRRVLGIMRHDGERRRLAPPAAARPVASGDADASPAAGQLPRAQNEPGIAVAGAPPRRALAWALVVALLLAAELELALSAPRDTHLLAALTAAPITAPLLWRRRRPVRVAAAVLGAIALQSSLLNLDALPVFDIAAIVCAAYALGAYVKGRGAVVGLVLFVAGAGAHAAVFYPAGLVPAILGGSVMPWTIGRIVRGHRLLTHEGREETARVEQRRVREARAAVVAERMRVARELHDAVAHSISVIAIQAGGAEPIVERDPKRAAQCAALIETVGGEALSELGRLVGPLDRADAAAAVSHPSLAAVDRLACRTRDSGLRVELRIEGEPAVLPAGVDLAAFRIVQEALANASKHAGDSRAWVVVRYEDRAVEVEIGDDGRGTNAGQPVANGGGHGLIGIRERVALYRGTLAVGHRPSGGFEVRARLPIGQR
jgi:signal transduction histidine kinase